MCADANSAEAIFLRNTTFLLNNPGHVLWYKSPNLTRNDRLSPSGLFIEVFKSGLSLKRALARRLNMRALLRRPGMLHLKLLERLSSWGISGILRRRILLIWRPLVKICRAKLSPSAWLLCGYLVSKLLLPGPELVLFLPALLRCKWGLN